MRSRPILVFDFDGTLADTFEIFMKAYNDSAVKYGIPMVEQEFRAELQGMSARDVIRKLQISIWKLPFLVFSIKKRMKLQRDAIELFKDIVPLLQKLHAEGVQMGIVSANTVPIISHVMARYGLLDAFSFIVSERNIYGKHKYLSKVRHEHSDAQVYYVGDQVADMECAHRAKVQSIAVPWGFNTKAALAASKPDYLIETPQELEQIAFSSSR